MRATINCGCKKCCEKTLYGDIAPHRLTITKGRDGLFRAKGHTGINEIIEDVHSWDDVSLAYSDYMTWRLEYD